MISKLKSEFLIPSNNPEYQANDSLERGAVFQHVIGYTIEHSDYHETTLKKNAKNIRLALPDPSTFASCAGGSGGVAIGAVVGAIVGAVVGAAVGAAVGSASAVVPFADAAAPVGSPVGVGVVVVDSPGT